MNLVTIMRVRDEFAARPEEAKLHGHPTRPWGRIDWPVVLPEPFRSRAFAADSYVLLEVDSAGHAEGCRPLRAGAHPELDTFSCTLLMRPGHFAAALAPPAPQPRESLAGQWVMGLRLESLTAAAHRERRSSMQGTGTYEVNPSPRRPAAPARRRLRGEVTASDYRRIADQRISDGRLDARLALDERGVPTGCQVARSSGNQAIDERTCAVLIRRVRFTERVHTSGAPAADTVSLSIDLDRMLSSRPPFPQPIQIGQTVSGRLESGDRVSADGTFYDEYTFTAPSAASLRITMRSSELGPSLRVTFNHPPYALGEGMSDRSGREDVQVSVDVPAGASVRIQANAFERGTQGAYTLQVTAHQASSSPAPVPPAPGSSKPSPRKQARG